MIDGFRKANNSHINHKFKGLICNSNFSENIPDGYQYLHE